MAKHYHYRRYIRNPIPKSYTPQPRDNVLLERLQELQHGPRAQPSFQQVGIHALDVASRKALNWNTTYDGNYVSLDVPEVPSWVRIVVLVAT